MSGIIDFSGETASTLTEKLNGASLSLNSASFNGGYAQFYNGGYAQFYNGGYAEFSDGSYANFNNGSSALFYDGGSAQFYNDGYAQFHDGSFALFDGGYAQFLDGGYAQFLDGSFVVFSGLVSESPSLQIGAGAIPLGRPLCQLRSTGGMQAIALADGAPGQLLTIVHEQDGGSMVLTATTKSGWTTSITFNNVGDNVRLQFIDIAVGWIVLSSRGAAVV